MHENAPDVARSDSPSATKPSPRPAPHHIASPPALSTTGAEVARAGIPTIMMFVQSLHGISHNKIEDTEEEHLAMAVRAFDALADKALRWIERSAAR